MKRIIAIFLSMVLCLGLAACGREAVQPTAETATEAAAPSTPELVALDISSLGHISVSALDANGSYAVLCYSDYVEAGDSEVNFTEPVQNYLAVFDLAKNELIQKTVFANEENYWYAVRIREDGFDMVNQQMGELLCYDFDLQLQKTDTYPYSENREKAEQISGINSIDFDCRALYALSPSYGYAKTLVFYDQPEQFYILKNKTFLDCCQAVDHTVLVQDQTENLTQDTPQTVIRVLDFDSCTEINQLTVSNELFYNNIQFTNLNKTTVSIAAYGEDGSTDKVYLWQYRQAPKSIAFADDFCDVISEQTLDGKLDALCSRVRETYGITFECAPEHQFIRDDYNYSNDYPKVLFYEKALDLEYDLSLLPKMVYSEALCKDLDDPMSRFDDFRIYLVGSFPDEDVGAYVNSICCEETGEQLIIYIVYCCTDMIQKNFFHELMHTFEYRIWNYVPDFDEQWAQLNPDGFDYTEDYGVCFYEDGHEAWQEYFTRDYGMKNDLEDRATCFEELCACAINGGNWWLDLPPIVAKQRYLTQVLQASFPSLAEWDIFAKAFEE